MIIDIVVIVFLLLMVLLGLKNGFMKMLISLIGVIATLVATIFLAVPFANFLSGFIPFDNWIGTPIQGWIEGFGGIATVPVPTTGAEMANILSAELNIPTFISNMIGPWIFSAIPSGLAGETAAAVLAAAMCRVIVIAISAVLLFILIRIAVALLQRLFKSLTQIKFIGAIDKTFGLVLGAVKGYFIVLLVFTAMSAMMAFSFMQPVANQLENSKFSKWIYDNNFIANWLFGDRNEKEQNPENSNTTDGETKTFTDISPREHSAYIFMEGEQYQLIFN